MSTIRPRLNCSPKNRRIALSHRRPVTVPTRRLSVRSHFATPRRVGKVALSADAITQRGNIQVIVRARPQNSMESVPAYRNVVLMVDERLVIFDPKEQVIDSYFRGAKIKSGNILRKPNRDAKFIFDRVYDQTSTNQKIFEETIKKNIDTLLQGFNCSIFAYGATGSGKTFTMLGSGDSNPGLTFLTVMELYSRLKEMDSEFESEVSVSYLEVYNETVRDLLISNGKNNVLNVCEDENGVSIPNLSTHKPIDQDDLFSLLSDGNSRRTQHPTDHNAESSRSHAVFQVSITLRSRYTDLNNTFRKSKLVMVDLAGSERGSATGFNGDRFREGASINKSLLSLANCINALADGKKHIPYRDSKLTRILKDSLGGNCKTTIIANVSPSSLSYEDTLNTLRYADRAKHIRVNVKKNVVMVSARIAEYAKVVEEMQMKINSLAEENLMLKSSCSCQNPKVDISTSPFIIPQTLEIKDNEDDSCFDTNDFALLNDLMSKSKDFTKTEKQIRELETKLQIKKARINAINLVGFTDIADGKKGIERLEKQVYNIESQMPDLKNKLETIKKEIENLESSGCKSPINPGRLMFKSFYNEIALLKEAAKRRDSELAAILSINAKNELFLGKSIKLLRVVFNMLKFHKHTTRANENDFNSILAEFVGTRVAFEDQSNKLNIISSKPVQAVNKVSLNTTYTSIPFVENIENLSS